MAGTYVFRCDGNSRIGMGHLMRCLTIADRLLDHLQAEDAILFVCADAGSADAVLARGFRAVSLDGDAQDFGSGLERMMALLETLGSVRFCIVDSYAVTPPDLRRLREAAPVALLDDLGERAYPADLLINYHGYALLREYRELYGAQKVRFCLGGQYVPLRREFADDTFVIKEEVQTILITTGGGDKDNIGGRVARALLDCCPDCRIYLTAGRFHPAVSALRRLEAENDRFVLWQDVQDMAGLIRSCDLCVTAGGTTVYEISALGVPLICFSYAQNQERLTAYIGAENIAGYAGAWHKDAEGTLERIKKEVLALGKDKARREAYAGRERALTDGLGAERIARIIAEWDGN